MKILVIAEKPDMGRNIAAAIEPKAVNKRTHIEGQTYIITWAIGHLISLAEPDKYDEKYKKWRLEDLPILPEQFKLIPYPKTRDQLKVIADLAKHCDRIVNACDAGREGQYIFYLIQRHLRLAHPVQRLWISDLTPETIREGFANLRDGAEFENLTKAARARSEADWLIGMNGSRAFTTKHNVLLSVGRVQTPVLALIYDRQKQIEAFSSLSFFEVNAVFSQNSTIYQGLWQGDRIYDRRQAEAIAAKTAGQPGRIAEYEIKEAREYPFKLYDLTLLQREANAKYGFSAKKTLDLAQSLYEKHKVISYPRTNSNYVTEPNIAEMHRALEALKGSPYDRLVRGADKRLVHKNNLNICNPAKVEDHHAILPTSKKPGSLSSDEQKVYDLIVRRFLSHFYPPALYKVHTVRTEAVQEIFKTTVKEILQLGWKQVYADQINTNDRRKGKSDDADSQEEEETDIPFELEPKTGVLCERSEVKEKETQPPKPYTEGTLLKAMESAGKQIDDDELRDAMKDSGLGTPATRASTIERLKQVGYIDMKGKRIELTQKGRTAIEVIRGAGVELLTSPEMTGHWERRLNEISKGLAAESDFMEKVKQFAALIIHKVRSQPAVARTAFGDGNSGPQAKRSSRKRAASSQSAENNRKPGKSAASDTQAPAANKIAACPRSGCGGTIFMGRKGYGCSHYKQGCRFVIWKTSFGKTLSDTMVRALIEKGRTSKLKFKNDDGSSYDAQLILTDPDTGSLEVKRL